MKSFEICIKEKKSHKNLANDENSIKLLGILIEVNALFPSPFSSLSSQLLFAEIPLHRQTDS